MKLDEGRRRDGPVKTPCSLDLPLLSLSALSRFSNPLQVTPPQPRLTNALPARWMPTGASRENADGWAVMDLETAMLAVRTRACLGRILCCEGRCCLLWFGLKECRTLAPSDGALAGSPTNPHLLRYRYDACRLSLVLDPALYLFALPRRPARLRSGAFGRLALGRPVRVVLGLGLQGTGQRPWQGATLQSFSYLETRSTG
jgi:hypothetical protein